jgi:hypothetical protein
MRWLFRHKIIVPISLDDKEKVVYLAKMGDMDIYPTAFSEDNPLTLIALLARRIVKLENIIPSS